MLLQRLLYLFKSIVLSACAYNIILGSIAFSHKPLGSTKYLGDIVYSRHHSLAKLQSVNGLNVLGGAYYDKGLIFLCGSYHRYGSQKLTENLTQTSLSKLSVGIGERIMLWNKNIFGFYTFFDVTTIKIDTESRYSFSQLTDTVAESAYGFELVTKQCHTVINLTFKDRLYTPKNSLYYSKKSEQKLDFKIKYLKGFHTLLPSMGLYLARAPSYQIILGGIFNLEYSLFSNGTVRFTTTWDDWEGLQCTLGFSLHYQNYSHRRNHHSLASKLFNSPNNPNIAYKLFDIPIERHGLSYSVLAFDPEHSNDKQYESPPRGRSPSSSRSTHSHARQERSEDWNRYNFRQHESPPRRRNHSSSRSTHSHARQEHAGDWSRYNARPQNTNWHNNGESSSRQPPPQANTETTPLTERGKVEKFFRDNTSYSLEQLRWMPENERKSWYRKQILAWHPDKNPKEESAKYTNLSAQLNSYYQDFVLPDGSKRYM